MTKSEMFEKEFKDLLVKYDVEMNVRENTTGWASYAEGVDFDFMGEVIEDKYVEYPSVSFGRWENGK